MTLKTQTTEAMQQAAHKIIASQPDPDKARTAFLAECQSKFDGNPEGQPWSTYSADALAIFDQVKIEHGAKPGMGASTQQQPVKG